MNKIGRMRALFACFIFVFVAFSGLASAQEIGIEELTELYGEEIIITASKREQKISDSPSAISIITAEDIKLLGATQLSEVFMMIPGIHIGYSTHNTAIMGGIRGFHKASTNTVVVLFDGIPWDFEFYGVPEFNPFPVALEEIERIEVLRGPGSSLYGPDAVSGVINVITKKLEDTKGNLVSLTAGEKNTFVGTYVHGGSIKNKINYRISSTWDQRDSWGFIANLRDPSGKYMRLNSSFDFLIDDNSKINLFGSFLNVREQDACQEKIGAAIINNSEKYATSITYTSKDPNIMVRGFWQEKDVSTWIRGNSPTDTWLTSTFDLTMKSSGKKGVEFQHTFEPIEKDIFVWGVNFTQLTCKTDELGGRRRTDLSGVFVDNTYDFNDKFTINTSLRLDNHPNVGDTLSHRLSFLYSPWVDHNFRFTWASSFRNPGFVESYYNITHTGTYLGILPATLTTTGSESLEAERAETLELGYRGMLTKKLSMEANVFYTKLVDFIQQTSSTVIGATVVTTAQYQNLEDFYQLGTEIEFEYPFTNWLSGIVNYTYYDQWEEDPFNNTVYSEKTPCHMFNGQLRAQVNEKLTANLSLHYRGSSLWETLNTYTDSITGSSTTVGGKAKDFIIANLNLLYKFQFYKKDAEISLNCFNLFDAEYDDYPVDSSEIHRRITASFRCKF